MDYPIPYPVIVIMNGALSVVISIMFAFACVHMFILWRGKTRAHGDRYTQWTIIRAMYWDNKPSIAWMVIAGSLAARFWLMFYISDAIHNASKPDFVIRNAFALYLAFNASLLIGVVCWIRNVSPYPIPNWVWLIVFSAALGFGIAVERYGLSAFIPG
jgi:hypothetical protein